MHPIRRLARIVALSVFSLALAAGAAGAQLLRVYYPDIEQGSATLVVSPTGHALLIDGGSELKVTEDSVEEFINDLIDAGVVTSLDYVVATHYDEDHVGRLEHVFYLVPMPPGAVAYDRGTVGGTPSTFAYADYADGAAQHNRTTITPGTVLDLGGGVTARCVVVNGELPSGPPVDISGSAQYENSASVAMVIEYGDFDLWIGGDLTGNPAENVADVESAAAPFAGDLDVYTFDHHGSKTSSTPSFLAVIKAEVGIVQSGIDNDFGHPNAIVVTQLLDTDDTDGNTPLVYQLNKGNPTDNRSDDSLAAGIADCDDVTTATGDPGPIVLLSDGDSYQLRGCSFGTVGFETDGGSGPVGDYPPAVLRVARSPHVPLASEGVTVQAPIVDEGALTAVIEWTLGGVAQTSIAMTASGGVYSGTIPAQANGAAVSFRVAATDSLAQTERSPAQGYFSGTTTIATLRQNDADGVLIPKRFGARIEGDVTVEPGVFHPFVTQLLVQDATGGVQVFDTSVLSIDRGDHVVVIGDLEQFAGMTEISLAEKVGNVGATVIAPGTPPSPTVVTVSQVGESLEGQLIRINDVTVVSGMIYESGNSNLTITDDGGISTVTLRIDGDTNIPGVVTPTQPFDVVGVVGQFESFSSFPYDAGYQLTPRDQDDLLSDEVHPPVLLINEVHADPSASSGDANGDGVISSTGDEFVELVNTTSSPLDVSGWTISDGVGVKHTFAASTIVPAREVVVVFASGTPTGDFGNAMANGLVFTASGGSLGLNNTGDTVTLRNASSVVIDTMTYGSEGGQDQSLVRQPDFTNVPFVQHSTATGSGGSLYSPGTRVDGTPATIAVGSLLLSEVMYDPSGSDGGLEWIELYNPSALAIDLSKVCLGSGGGDYTSTLAQLSGSIAAGDTFVVGGPTSSASNGNPTFDQVLDFSPDLQNSGADADGVALFNVRCGYVTPLAVPIDAVVFGGANTSGLIDETGSANAPEVGDAPGGSTVERVDLAGAWQIQGSPTPGSSPLQGPQNQAPTVTISDPTDNSTVTAGASVLFAGTASDPEDGNLTASLVWTSDLDGAIGNGGSFSTTSLSVGTHVVTASVTDSGSLQGSDTVTITVDPAPSGSLILSEVLYNPSGSDDGLEWVELYNAGATTIDLSSYSLGSGGNDYTTTKVQLSGSIAPGATFVVGGPTSNSSNNHPSFDQVLNFSPDLQNGGSTADGVALFDVPASQVNASTVPIDAVVFGTTNSSGLIDETGSANAPEAGTASAGSSVERVDLAGAWQNQSSPTPNSTPLP